MNPSPATSRSRRIVLVAVVAVGIALAIRVWHDRQGSRGGGSPSEREQRVRAHPDDEQAQLDWGDTLHNLHRTDEAEAAFKTAAGLAPNDPRPLNALGMLALERKRSDEALGYFRQSLKQMPNDANIWRSSALLLQQRDPDGALQAFERALQLDPNDAVSCRQIGRIEVSREHIKPGLAHLQRAAALDPNDLMTQDLLGDAAIRDGKPAIAKTAFERVLALRPDDPQALLGSADVTLQLDPSPAGLTRAGRQIEQVLAARPGAYAYLVRGRWNLLQRRYQPAVSDLKTALKQEPKLYSAHSFLSQAYAAVGQTQLARSEADAYMMASDAARTPQRANTAEGQGQ